MASSSAAAAPASPPAEPNSFVERVRRDVEWLAGVESRVVGQPGHDRIVEELLAKVRAVPAARVWTRTFPVIVPSVQRAELRIDTGPQAGTHRVYPLWPAGVKPHTTPAAGLSGRLIYVGRGEAARVPPRSLQGQIAVMELAGGAWDNAFNAGAAAVLLLGSPRVSERDARAHTTPLSIDAPRFYVPEGPLAAALRDGRATAGRLLVQAGWREAAATDIWVLVKPPAGTEPRRALVVAAPLDAMSIVPEQAPGADAAVDAAFVLNLLRRFAERPPDRPVLLAFLDAYAINQLGMRELLLALAVEDSDRQPLLEDDEDRQRLYDRHEELARELASRDSVLEYLALDRYRPLHAYVKDEVNREVIAVETVMHPKRLRLAGLSGPEAEALAREVEALAARRAEFFAAQRRLLNRVAAGASVDETARLLWARARDRIERQAREARAQVRAHHERRVLREELLAELGLTGRERRPLEFVLGLDLSDAGVAAGPMIYDRYWLRTETRGAAPFTRWLADVSRREAGALWPGPLRGAVNLGPLAGVESQDSFCVGEVATLTFPCANFGTAGATWGTLDAPRARVDTPEDLPARLDWRRLAPQVEATARLVDRLVRGPGLDVASRTPPSHTRVDGVVVDRSPGQPVPRLPMPDFLTTLLHGRAQGSKALITWMPEVPGLRRLEFRRTGADGRFRFEAVGVHESAWYNSRFVQSWLLDEEGQIARGVDLRKSAGAAALNFVAEPGEAPPLRAVAFTCRQVTALQLFDPRFLQALPAGSVLDVRRGAEPQRLNFCLYGGQLACLLEPGTRWALVLRSGIARNRMAVLNVAEPGEADSGEVRGLLRGMGTDTRRLTHLAERAATDFYRLDEHRLREYRSAGITAKPIEELRRTTAALLEKARQAREADDGAAWSAAASGALANEVRAYQAVRDTAADVVRGAVLLLLLLVPFSFTLERLAIGTPKIYRQVLGTMLLFAAMTAVVWSFHPAFRISSQPLMIILAVGILFISLLVLGVIYTKFEAGLSQMRSGRAESSAAETSRSGVLLTAVRLGIANMRRRRLRTALTGVTIMLITFTLLCFMSTGRYVGQRRMSLDSAPARPGVLVRLPSRRPMPWQARAQVAALVGASTDLAAGDPSGGPTTGPSTAPAVSEVESLGADRPFCVRAWWCNPINLSWRLHVHEPRTGRTVSLKAALGVSGREDRVSGLADALPDWQRFAEGGGCYLPRPAAEELGLADPNGPVRPGSRVLLAGRELDVIGLFEPAALEDAARDLDGQSLLPTDFSALSSDQRARVESVVLDELSAALEEGVATIDEGDLPALPGTAVAIVPEGMLTDLSGAHIRSIAVGASDGNDAEALASELTGRLAFPIYYGGPQGARAVVTSPMVSAPPRGLLIPVLIGGLMVFSILVSSVAERKRDVYVFTSLGLGPMHVGVLFLAEAVTYALMGSVFGYVVGQALATGLTRLGLLGGLTLNYSGTGAIAVMFLVLVIVVLSSLVPAYLAGRMAAPSNQRTWRVPDPVGDVIRDALPFTATPQTAPGVLQFLLEYLDAHREGSIGHFSADRLRVWRQAGEGGTALCVAAEVWLAPYDLGVRQDVRLTILPPAEAGVCAVCIELVRASGQVRSWRGLNRTFLGDLRKQLLGWRKLKPKRLLEYIAEGRRELEKAGDA